MYLTLPSLEPFWLCVNIRPTAIQGLQFVYLPNFIFNIPIPCYIFIKHMNLFVFFCWGGGYIMFSLVFVVTGRCFDKSMIGINYTKNIFSHFPFSLVQWNAWHEVILIKMNIRRYFTIYIIWSNWNWCWYTVPTLWRPGNGVWLLSPHIEEF
jgi:hypothetical protein